MLRTGKELLEEVERISSDAERKIKEAEDALTQLSARVEAAEKKIGSVGFWKAAAFMGWTCFILHVIMDNIYK